MGLFVIEGFLTLIVYCEARKSWLRNLVRADWKNPTHPNRRSKVVLSLRERNSARGR